MGGLLLSGSIGTGRAEIASHKTRDSEYRRLHLQSLTPSKKCRKSHFYQNGEARPPPGRAGLPPYLRASSPAMSMDTAKEAVPQEFPRPESRYAASEESGDSASARHRKRPTQ